MDSVNVVAQLIQNTVTLSTAVELGVRWRELAEKMGKLSSAHIAGYEAPHRAKNGEVGPQVSSMPYNDTDVWLIELMTQLFSTYSVFPLTVHVEASL